MRNFLRSNLKKKFSLFDLIYLHDFYIVIDIILSCIFHSIDVTPTPYNLAMKFYSI